MEQMLGNNLHAVFNNLLDAHNLPMWRTPLQAEEFKLGLLHGDPEVFAYEISVIELALKHADGDHRLDLVYMPNTSQERILSMLEHNRAINIFFTGYSKERELRFRQVDIPLTRGLLGHRVFIKNHVPSLKRVKTLDDLRQFSIGSGIGWPDTEIFKAAGFNVIEASYQNLWKMLYRSRFALFNRGINEVTIELAQQADKGFNFEIDPYVMVSYPFDYFIYLNRSSTQLYKIVKQGLERAYENGAFMENFLRTPAIANAINLNRPQDRIHFRIDNPLMSDRAKAIASKYWHQF
jgi:hypothetical protein